MLAAIVPPDSTRNRLPHAPDGVLSRKNHLLARLQLRVDRSGDDELGTTGPVTVATVPDVSSWIVAHREPSAP
jgi:hypothetical protein